MTNIKGKCVCTTDFHYSDLSFFFSVLGKYTLLSDYNHNKSQCCTCAPQPCTPCCLFTSEHLNAIPLLSSLLFYVAGSNCCRTKRNRLYLFLCLSPFI